MEKKLVKMNHPLFAGDLLRMGIKFVKIETDEDFPFWDNYYYEDTPEFREAYNQVKNNIERYKRFMEKRV